MAKYDTSIYNKRLERIASELQSKIRAINENGDLSNAGKARWIDEAKEESRIARVKLEEDFRADAEQKRAGYLRKKEPKPSHRDIVRRQAEEWELYPNLYSDAVRANAELDIFERLLAFQQRAEWRDIARNGDDRYFTAKLASEDTDELKRIQREGLPFLPAEVRKSMNDAYTSRIENLEKQQVPAELVEFDTDVERFNYSLEAFDKHGTYTDYRKKESPPPENETTLRPYEPPPVQGNGSAEGAEN